MQGEGDEFILKTLTIHNEIVTSSLEFQGSEEELQLVNGLADVMMEIIDHKDEAEAEKEFVLAFLFFTTKTQIYTGHC